MNEISLTILWASHVLDVSWSLRIMTLGTVRNSSHLYCLCKEHTSVFQSLTSLSISETYIVWNKNSKCSEIMYLWQVFISHTLLGDTHIIFWSHSLSKETAIFRQFCALLDAAPFTYNGKFQASIDLQVRHWDAQWDWSILLMMGHAHFQLHTPSAPVRRTTTDQLLYIWEWCVQESEWQLCRLARVDKESTVSLTWIIFCGSHFKPMDPLNVLYFYFRWVLKLLTSHKCHCSHPVT